MVPAIYRLVYFNSALCINLKYLEVSLKDYSMDQPRLRMLLDGLHNASVLEQLTIAATVFKIDNMEDLHINLPYLKQLTLYDILSAHRRSAKNNNKQIGYATHQE